MRLKGTEHTIGGVRSCLVAFPSNYIRGESSQTHSGRSGVAQCAALVRKGALVFRFCQITLSQNFRCLFHLAVTQFATIKVDAVIKQVVESVP